MSPFALTFKSLRHRKFTVALTVVSLALGVALLLGVERIRHQARTSFTNTISGTDLIVGARSGSVSLLLSSVFRIGNPTQNISWETYEKIAENPQVAWTIPISLGDSHRGYRVLGTTNEYFKHYRYANKRNLALDEGAVLEHTFDAVLGAEVAASLGYHLDDEIVLAHGSGEVCFVDHADKPFHVTGILKPTGTPVDRTVHVLLAGMEAIHEGWDGSSGGQDHECHDHCDGHGHHEDALADIEAMLAGQNGDEPKNPEQITAFLVGMKSRADGVMLQRSINTYRDEPLSAVLPGVALQELWSVIGVAEKTLLVISAFVVAVSLAGMLSMLMTSLNERRREMAILRSVGARPAHIVALVVGEAVAVTVIAILVGISLLYGLLLVVRPIILAKLGLFVELSGLSGREVSTLGLVLLVGLVVGLLPAWRCYRSSLSDGLMVKI
jgi:putative ABC transport system permease protein